MKASTQFKKEHKADFGKEKIEILYEDKDLIVIYKPEGMLSVPYPGSHARTALDTLEQIFRKRGTWSSNHRPLTVHRLDRETSGVMMFALNEVSQKRIMDTWHTMVTERLYRAVAENPKEGFLPLSGTIEDELAYNAYNIGFVPKAGDKPNNKALSQVKAAGKNQESPQCHGKNGRPQSLCLRHPRRALRQSHRTDRSLRHQRTGAVEHHFPAGGKETAEDQDPVGSAAVRGSHDEDLLQRFRQ